MTVPKAKQDPVLRRYSLRRWRLPVKGGRLSIVCPRTMEDLVARLDAAAFGTQERMPYWADVWASSVALARYLRRGPLLRGRHVLDLGCGVGVAGVAARTLGADVDFADWEPDALAFAAFNAAENPPVDRQPAACRCLVVDWCRDELTDRYHDILLADTVYEERNHEPILRLFSRNLRPEGRAFVADPGRATADAFFARAAATHHVDLEMQETWFPDRRVTVRLARLTPR